MIFELIDEAVKAGARARAARQEAAAKTVVLGAHPLKHGGKAVESWVAASQAVWGRRRRCKNL